MPTATDSFDFSVDIHEPDGGGRIVVAVAGEIDLATAGELETIVRGELERAPILLDLARVTFLDSSGVRVLDRLLKQGGDLRMAPGLHDAVEQVLRLTGMYDALPFAEAGPGPR